MAQQNTADGILKKKACSVHQLFAEQAEPLQFKSLFGALGFTREIKTSQPEYPGLSLTGFPDPCLSNRVLIFGPSEILYLDLLDPVTREDRLRTILQPDIPLVIVAQNLGPHEALILLCFDMQVPLFTTSLSANTLVGRLGYFLNEQLSPSVSFQGTFVEVYGIGILLQGDAAIGKSEAALGLVDRNHRLVADESVTVQLKHDTFLEGTGSTSACHMVEVRGIGMINVTQLYGTICVRNRKSLDLIVRLEEWDDSKAYDRLGVEESFATILGIDIPFHLLPVKPGRDVVLLIETVARNFRLKQMGIFSAKDFSTNLSQTIAEKQKRQLPVLNHGEVFQK